MSGFKGVHDLNNNRQKNEKGHLHGLNCDSQQSISMQLVVLVLLRLTSPATRLAAYATRVIVAIDEVCYNGRQ